jgi:predicted P-loop ATPase
MTRKQEMMALDDPNPHYIEIDKREQNSLVIDAQQNGVDCWDLDVDRLIKSTYTKAYHPFIEYFNNLPKWDGVDRVSDLAKRVSTKEVWVNGFHRWMLGTVAQWMNIYPEGTANCVAPLLISAEQGWGKSTFCRMLMPKELRRYYTESFDLNAPSACESKLADYGLINLDEFDKYSEKKQPALKNLMQRNDLNITRAYQQTTSRLHRIASFIGTSNSRDLMKDKTGSRRFICVELEHEIDCETPIDYPQLYAQLKEELTELGERHYFSKAEEAQIQKNNRKYYHTSVEEEAFYRHFRFAQKGDEGAQFLTASAIYKQLVKDEGSVLSGISAYKFSCLLSKIGDRVDTKYCNGYYVVRV